ncbi:MAG: hypothetical protein QGG50_00215 [Methanopyri archaeon]|nr:hypothetical protein [Methanopyri archaeon]
MKCGRIFKDRRGEGDVPQQVNMVFAAIIVTGLVLNIALMPVIDEKEPSPDLVDEEQSEAMRGVARKMAGKKAPRTLSDNRTGDPNLSERERLREDMRTTNKRVALSVPSLLSISRSGPERSVVVAITNDGDDRRCFCVYPHLDSLDGPGSWGYTIDRDLDSLHEEWWEGIDHPATVKTLMSASPRECWAGDGKCSPNSWFDGRTDITVLPGGRASLGMLLDVPNSAREAPVGRWRFIVDVCEYRPPCEEWDPADPSKCVEWMVGCEACMPELCRQEPVYACDGTTRDDCYSWYDSERFIVNLEE